MVVYPRWRGELNIGNGFAAAASGLSPLARGTRPPRRCIPRDRRFIPAGAGNTVRRGGSTTVFSVYPRWRGEYINMQRERLPLAGLSPLARGTLPLYMPECRCYRFIPAGAGNTSSLHGRNKRHSVYPRWRGEHPEITLNWLSVSGLSPLARGTPRLGVRVGIIGRFIPAGAGNTWSWWKPTVPVAVYPRWRGEHRSPSRVVYVIVGLSPLARGTPH